MEQSFGQWVRHQRLAKGLGPVECARRVGWSHTQWVRQENDSPRKPDGQSPKPRRVTCEKIAAALNLPESEVLEHAGYLAQAPSISYLRDEDDAMNRSGSEMSVKENRPSITDALAEMLGEIVSLREQIHRDQHETELSRQRTLAKLAKIGGA